MFDEWGHIVDISAKVALFDRHFFPIPFLHSFIFGMHMPRCEDCNEDLDLSVSLKMHNQMPPVPCIAYLLRN